MAIQPTFLLIADIAGYTRFMKFHRASLAHAQDIVAQLLEAVIDATQPHLTLAKLEGDAAFFYLAFPRGAEPRLEFVAEQVAAIYRAFHRRVSDLKINTLCMCDGCVQAGNLKIKLVGHLGEAAVQRVKHLTELAGVDVILVHRMLKNDVPVTEYLLMTEPVHERIDAQHAGARGEPSARARRSRPDRNVLCGPRALRRRGSGDAAPHDDRAPRTAPEAHCPDAARNARSSESLRRVPQRCRRAADLNGISCPRASRRADSKLCSWACK